MRRDGQKSTSSFEAIGSWLKDKKKNVYFFNIDEYNKQNGNKPLWYVLTPADREKVERKLKEGSTNLPFKDFSNALSHEEIAKLIKEELHIDMLKDQLEELINKAETKQIICHGAPGTGKTYTIKEFIKANGDENTVESDKNFVQFHPSYDYTDFIEGLRPVSVEGQISFVRMDGIFKKFCREVVDKRDPNKNYFFFIDEINRADLSKVFGELMYCLEEGYRGKNNRIQTQYANLPAYKINEQGKAEEISDDVFKEGFYIPDNVIIIGTMNDIDRSVESFDFAMQRRFAWINVDADIEISADVLKAMWNSNPDSEDDQEGIETLALKIKECAVALNKKVADTLGEEYKIGHAYYKKAAHFYKGSSAKDKIRDSLEKVYKYSIEPVLVSYLRDRRNENQLKDFYSAFFTIHASDSEK